MAVRLIRKKFLPVFLAIIICFSSFVMQVQKAQAFAWLGVAPVAYGGAGAYALGALAVGAIATGLGLEYGDEINKHATSVWRNANDTVKSAWSATLDAANATGNYVVDVSNDLKDYFRSRSNALVGTVVSHAIERANKSALPAKTSQEITDMKTDATITVETQYPDVTRTKKSIPYGPTHYNLTLNSGFVFAYVSGTKPVFFKTLNFVANDRAVTVSPMDFHVSNGSADYGNSIAVVYPAQASFAFTSAIATYNMRTVEQALTLINRYKYDSLSNGEVVVIPLSAVATYASKFLKAQEDVTKNLDSIKKLSLANAKPVTNYTDLPTVNGNDALITPQQPLTLDNTGTFRLPDGSVYTGNPAWEFPVPQVVPGTDKLTVPVDGVGTVELDTGVPVTPTTPPTTGDGGLLQNIWDWLKGILQSMLDAILSLAKLLGVIALLQGISTAIDTFKNYIGEKIENIRGDPAKNRIDWSKLTFAFSTVTTKFPFSIPWDFSRFLGQFNVEPQTPVIKIDIDKKIPLGDSTIPYKMKFDINFSMFDVIAKITRWGLVVVFDIFLITALRRFTPD